MSAAADTPFLALVKDFEILRVAVSRDLQTKLSKLFQEQRDEFFAEGTEIVPFDIHYTPDPDQISFIEKFKPPAKMLDALKNPLGFDVLDVTRLDTGSINGFFTADQSARMIWCQAFDRRRLISTRGFSIIYSGDTFRKLEEPGLTLDSRLAAVVENDRLYFHSFHAAKRLFDLSVYFKEATAEELKAFVENPRILFENPEMLSEKSGPWIRTKVSLVRQSKILEKESPSKIANEAKKYGLLIDVKKVNGKEKLYFPDDKKIVKDILRFLDEDYLTSTLTGTRYVSNSKRPITAPAA
jgi:hypothetical protein